MSLKTLIKGSLIMALLFLSACGSSLDEDIKTYESDAERLIELNSEFNDLVNDMDFDRVERMYFEEEETDLAFIQDLINRVDKELVPLADSLGHEVESIQVENPEVQEIHNIMLEDVQVKRDFTAQITSFLNAYASSIDSNEQLVTLSQSFITHQEERDNLIEAADSSEEIEEMNTLIDVLNKNSEALDEQITNFQSKESVEEKEQFAKEDLLPLIDQHIEEINALNLTTSTATRARTISLEMNYNYRTYFEERKNVMVSVEQLQELSLENLLSQLDTASTLDSQFEEALNNKKNEAP
ncbi:MULTISPECIES: EMYY motif lipoprotein [Jeotgalicoccus]|uniref:EMYY motif lipoprotein n=1 Tax=Jeotgalicoccus TaxID=227979 RepID=UPI00047CB0AE|nr:MULTISPECIES: EMYY motif lipoprotein [Jeotgalicoccus]QQD86034.1 EMYY motif lipoprotein [Jeotgalicoccus sp. ATCC 8456]